MAILNNLRNQKFIESAVKIDINIKNTEFLDFVYNYFKRNDYQLLEKNYESMVLFSLPKCGLFECFQSSNKIKGSELSSILLHRF